MRIAIYARYSTKHQRPRSIADQLHSCRAAIAKDYPKAEITEFSDYAISGSENDRKGLENLLDMARNGGVEIVYSEGLDRISRSLRKLVKIYEILKYHNIDMETIQENKVTELDIYIKGAFNQMQLGAIAVQVKRSHKARAEEGKMIGNPYGYRIKIRDGRAIKGERDIHPEEASVIRKIYQMYAEGYDVRKIVEYLNEQKIPSPSGKNSWAVSTLFSGSKRQDGILNNRTYHGYAIWGKAVKVRNPETGRKKNITKPESEWTIVPVPELKIIDNDLWKQVEAEKIRRANINPSKKYTGYPQTKSPKPYSGLVYCSCGAKKTLANVGRYVCSNYKKERKCTNARGMKIEKIHDIVFTKILSLLESQKKEHFLQLMQNGFHEQQPMREEHKRRLLEISEQVENLLVVLSKSNADEIAEKIAFLDNERKIIQADMLNKLDGIPDNVLSHTAELIRSLRDSCFTTAVPKKWTYLLSLLVKKIVLSPVPNSRAGEDVEVIFNEKGWFAFYAENHQGIDLK